MKRMGQKIKDFIEHRSGTVKAAAAVGGLYLFLAAIGHGCPIRWLSGIPCPGCGLSRAYLALLKLDLKGAFAYHPLFWAVPLLVLAAFWQDRISRRERKGSKTAKVLLVILGTAFMLVYIWRLLSGDPYMQIAIEESLAVRSFDVLLEHILFITGR